jgi:hypothetical protein
MSRADWSAVTLAEVSILELSGFSSAGGASLRSSWANQIPTSSYSLRCGRARGLPQELRTGF